MFNFIDGVKAEGCFERVKCPECDRMFFVLALSNMSQRLMPVTSSVLNEILIVKMNEYESRISYMNAVRECLARIRKELDRLDLAYPEISGKNRYRCIYCGSDKAEVREQLDLDRFMKEDWQVRYIMDREEEES